MKKYILAPLMLCGAAFMIVESAGYYKLLYGPSGAHIAWAMAILSEAFQHTLLIVPGATPAQNRSFKSVALLVFVLTVIAAGYNIYRPAVEAMGRLQRERQLTEILAQEIADNREDRRIFTTGETQQKRNAALSVKRRVETVQELKKIISNGTTAPLTLFEILHLFALRVAIQIATLSCAWGLGSGNAERKGTQRPRQAIKRWRARYLIIDRFGLNFDFIEENGFTWIDNLITGSGRNLADPDHKNFGMPYVQEYLDTIGERKCEANAIVTLPNVAQQLAENAIEEYLGAGALNRFARKKEAVRLELQDWLEGSGSGSAIERVLDAIENR